MTSLELVAPARCDRILLVLDGQRLEEVGRGKNRRILRGWWLHPSLNVWARRTHPIVQQQEIDAWVREIVRRCAGVEGIPGPVVVTVSYYFPTARRRDIDNYTPKFILDGLKAAGMIDDDDSETVVGLRCRIRVDPLNPRTEVMLEAASSAGVVPLPLARPPAPGV